MDRVYKYVVRSIVFCFVVSLFVLESLGSCKSGLVCFSTNLLECVCCSHKDVPFPVVG